MRWMRAVACGLILPILLWMAAPEAAPSRRGRRTVAAEGGPIHGLIVRSSNVEDLSSIESIRDYILQPGTDREQAERLFSLVVKFRDQRMPPIEGLHVAGHVHDPVKIFNVYGYCQCCCAAAIVEALARAAGIPARGWALNGHSVPELFYDGRWHMYDASLINYFMADGGHVASVEEISQMGAAAFTPQRCRFIDAGGWYPAKTHKGIVSGLEEYQADRINLHEHTYTVGHRAGVSLRRGETLTRRWDNRGLALSVDTGEPWRSALTATGTNGSHAYLNEFYPGYRMGLVGNGELIYQPDLSTAGYRGGILSESGVACTEDDGRLPALHPSGSGEGQVVFPFSSGYVFLGGRIKGDFTRESGAGAIEIAISLNNGLDWETIWSAGSIGRFTEEIDLSSHIDRRYQYLVRLTMRGAPDGATGVGALEFHHDIQNSQRALPLLVKGSNRITVTAPEPAIATRTIEGTLTPTNDLNATYLDFHPETRNLDAVDGVLAMGGESSGTLTFPVTTPGEIRAIRFGGSFRCGTRSRGVRLLVSADDGASWKVAGDFTAPPKDFTRFVTFEEIAPGTRKALVRYELNRPGTSILFNYRIDVDYVDPRAGVRPVKVTYEWMEGDKLKTDEHLVSRYPCEYTIRTDGDPIMRSLRLEGR